MNPSSSSSVTLKKICPRSGVASKSDRKQKKKKIRRNPLQDLNGTHNNSSTTGSNSGHVSTSMSIEAPRGCLRFFLSHSSSTKTPFNGPIKSLPRTPISAPTGHPSRASSISQPTVSKETRKCNKNLPCLCHWQYGKKPISKGFPKCKKKSSTLGSSGILANKLPPGSGDVKQDMQQCRVKMIDDNDANLTPVTKLATRLALDCRVVDKVVDDDRSNTSSNSKTPPVQASVSPEVQCGSSMVSTTTPACYGAGYVVSGATDKRKCRPRGILTVDCNRLGFDIPEVSSDFDTNDNEEENVVSSSIMSMVPQPAEASMRWLLSPCDEEDENEKQNSDDDSCQFQTPAATQEPQSLSPLCNHGFSSDICNISDNSNINTNNTGKRRRRSTSLLSSTELSEFQGFMGPLYDDILSSSPRITPSREAASFKESKEERKCCYNMDGKNSPFSMDTLGSENVIQTPESDSSSGRYNGQSWLTAEGHKKFQLDSELASMAMNLQIACLSAKSHDSIWDPISSSFQFNSLTAPSNSVDYSQFQKVLGDQDSWISNSALDNLSQTQMQVSWREGLVSRIFEMDEFDSCRCLSDEEEDVNSFGNSPLKSHQSPEINVDTGNDETLKSAFRSSKPADKEANSEGKGTERIALLRSSTCAESISTDGGSLFQSEDSDWTQCYKNHLFEILQYSGTFPSIP